MIKYIIYVKHDDPFNDMEITCDDANEMARCAAACIKQGYKEVRAVVESEASNE